MESGCSKQKRPNHDRSSCCWHNVGVQKQKQLRLSASHSGVGSCTRLPPPENASAMPGIQISRGNGTALTITTLYMQQYLLHESSSVRKGDRVQDFYCITAPSVLFCSALLLLLFNAALLSTNHLPLGSDGTFSCLTLGWLHWRSCGSAATHMASAIPGGILTHILCIISLFYLKIMRLMQWMWELSGGSRAGCYKLDHVLTRLLKYIGSCSKTKDRNDMNALLGSGQSQHAELLVLCLSCLRSPRRLLVGERDGP